MREFAVLLFFFIYLSEIVYAQEVNTNRRKIEATRIEDSPKIDGDLSDAVWQNVPIAKDFIMMRPTNGDKEPTSHKTEVKLVYDDNAIYISAMMFDPEPDKIPKELTNRDGFGNSDFFMVMINPIDDGQNPNMFIVTAAGVQIDAKVSNGNNEDYNWSAVWDSAVSMNDNGWSVELKIPYRALRFANESIQSWGINFHREIRNLNARYTWNHIDNTTGRWTQYDGLYENFRDIKPPTRLAFYPYASVISDTYDGYTVADWNVGMDVKYGITENFTLDATLIPDFSQAGFDRVVLNLGPFEQQFSEQRQFFTEGIELFNKGSLFYTRRIGASPIDQFENERELINEDNFTNGKRINDTIVNNPNKVQMLNAIKISGRTKGGLGIGFFNAITDKTELTIERTIEEEIGGEIEKTKSQRKEITNPFSNYNIMVLDQQFNQNSAITLINTNVTRDGRFRDANATGLLWHVEDKGSKYNIDGSFKITDIKDDINNFNTGYSFDTSFGKQSGNWVGEIGYNFENKDYNPNDLGILFSNNEQSIYSWLAYRILQPKGNFNNYQIRAYNNVNFQHASGIFTGVNSGLSFWGQTKKRNAFGANFNYSSKRKDYFEPRQGSTSGVFFERPKRINVNQWGSSDFRKKLAVEYEFWMTFFDETIKDISQLNYGFGLNPRYRFNDSFSLNYGFGFSKSNNQFGYVNQTNLDVIFGQRDRTSFNNSLSGKYSFSSTSSVSLAFRHNWSKVPYKDQFYTLDTNNGRLLPSSYTDLHDVNFNSWNVDLNYIWQINSGSQLIAFYRNSIHNFNNKANQSFGENLDELFAEPMQHLFSLRLVYFIDYNNIKNIF